LSGLIIRKASAGRKVIQWGSVKWARIGGCLSDFWALRQLFVRTGFAVMSDQGRETGSGSSQVHQHSVRVMKPNRRICVISVRNARNGPKRQDCIERS